MEKLKLKTTAVPASRGKVAPVGLWRTRLEDGEFLIANKATANILGFPSTQDIIGHKSTEFYRLEDRQQMLARLAAGESIFCFQTQMKTLGGKDIWVSLTVVPHFAEGYLEGCIEDITEKKLMEAELEQHRFRCTQELEKVQEQIQQRLEAIICDQPL